MRFRYGHQCEPLFIGVPSCHVPSSTSAGARPRGTGRARSRARRKASSDSSGMTAVVGPRRSPRWSQVAGCWSRPSSHCAEGAWRIKGRLCRERGRSPARRQKQEADGRGHLGPGPLHVPVRQERRREAVLGGPRQRRRRDDEPAPGVAGRVGRRCRRRRRCGRLLVGEPRQLGVDQEVRAGQVERQRHAVGLDFEAGLGRAAVIARAGQPEPLERDRPTRPRPAATGPRSAPAAGSSAGQSFRPCSRSSREANSIRVAAAWYVTRSRRSAQVRRASATLGGQRPLRCAASADRASIARSGPPPARDRPTRA